jgi:type 1 glutamine amidotransferase
MKNLKLCMISGSFEYDSEVSLNIFSDYLEKNCNIRPTMIVYKSEDDDVSLEPIDDTDVLLVFTRRLNTSGRELKRFQDYCASGKPIIGIRTASHAFQNWLAFDKEVLGGNYQGHYGGGPITRVKINSENKDHPILDGIYEFDSYGSLYKNTPIAEDATLLLTGKIETNVEPLAWTRVHQDGRVFYTSLGHQKDFEQELFLKLLANAVFYVAGI